MNTQLIENTYKDPSLLENASGRNPMGQQQGVRD